MVYCASESFQLKLDWAQQIEESTQPVYSPEIESVRRPQQVDRGPRSEGREGACLGMTIDSYRERSPVLNEGLTSGEPVVRGAQGRTHIPLLQAEPELGNRY
jgi:hypothetical protein